MRTNHGTHDTRPRRYVQHWVVFPLLVACALLTSPLLVEQTWGQSKLPSVGIIVVDATVGAPAAGNRSEVVLRALADQGWIDGQNVAFEVRNAIGNPPRFAEVAAELVQRNVDVIFADSAPALRAAYTATRTIPIIVGDYTTDPVAQGYAQSYNRPGRNVTGVFLDAPAFSGKWLDLLKEVVPDLSRVVVLWDPSPGDAHLRAIKAIAPSFGIRLQVIEVHTPEDIDKAGSRFDSRTEALIILPAPITYAENERLASLAADERLPAVSIFPVFAAAGGAFAYGPDQSSVDSRSAALVSRVLKGANPAELPIERPTTFKLVVNMKTANALGITIPQSILLRADEVIR